VQTIAACALAVVLYLATLEAIKGRMTVGEFTSFIAALMLVTAPLRRLVNVAGPLQQGIAAARASSMSSTRRSSRPADSADRARARRGRVRDVQFGYPLRWITCCTA